MARFSFRGSADWQRSICCYCGTGCGILARSLGGIFADRTGAAFGLRGRVYFLGAVLLLEGVALIAFSQMTALALAVPAMIVFSIFVQMSEGATYSVVPFINPRALGSVAGIVGAGGNAGAVGAGFLFRMESLASQDAFAILGLLVMLASGLIAFVRFSPEAEAAAAVSLPTRLPSGLTPAPEPVPID